MSPAFCCFVCEFDLLQLELVADGQHTTVGVPLIIVIKVIDSGQRSSTAEVKSNTVVELVRETDGDSKVEGFDFFYAFAIVRCIDLETRLYTNLQSEALTYIEVSQDGDVDVVDIC